MGYEIRKEVLTFYETVNEVLGCYLLPLSPADRLLSRSWKIR